MLGLARDAGAFVGEISSRFTLENPPEAAKALSQWDAKLGKAGLLFRGVVAKLKHAQAIYSQLLDGRVEAENGDQPLAV